MQRIPLGAFTRQFLRHHQLEDFSLVFVPMYVRSPRRVKRATALVDAGDPESGRPLPGTWTAKDLLDKYLQLVPQTQAWLEGPGRYAMRLSDDVGVPVGLGEKLADLRGRAARRSQVEEERAAKILRKAFSSCERLLEPARVRRLVKEILAERHPS
jgi:hypothetical protein